MVPPTRVDPSEPRPVDVDHGIGERPRRLLRQVVSDAAGDDPMLVGADELRAIRRGIRVWSAVGVALQRDGGNGDRRSLGQPSLEIVVRRLAVRKAESPPVVVDDDVDVVGVVEGCRAPIERRVVELPVR